MKKPSRPVKASKRSRDLAPGERVARRVTGGVTRKAAPGGPIPIPYPNAPK
jgi:hypothetical protein